MRLTPTRAIVWMALLCALWLPAIWGLQRLLPAVDGVPAPAALPVLGGAALLLLLGALFLGLSLRIEQARLRAALRAALRGDSAPPVPGDWKPLLDDVRAAMRASLRERDELAQRALHAEQALLEQGTQAHAAAEAAQRSLLQLQQQLQRQAREWRELLPLVPDADDARARVGRLERGAQALRDARERAQALQGGVADAAQALAGADAAQAARALLQRGTRLAESLQLLGLNFRLLLERLQLLPAARGEGLDALVQDLEPLCQQATAVLDALQQAEREPAAGSGPERARESLQGLAGAVGTLLAALQQADAELSQALEQAEEESVHDLRGLLEGSLATQPPAMVPDIAPDMAPQPPAG